MIHLLIGEDHTIVREGLISLLKNEQSISIVAEASNGVEVIEKLNECTPDIAIIDLNMPVMDGFETNRFIQENYKYVKVLILSMLDHEHYVAEALESGAKGYMLKNSGKEELLYAIRRIHAGGMYISPEIVAKLIISLQNQVHEIKKAAPPVALSKREIEVLSLMADGYTNNEIADKLFTSRRTIETHRKNLIEKTGSKNTASLIKFALIHGIVK